MKPRIGLISDYDVRWYRIGGVDSQSKHYLMENYSLLMESNGGLPWLIPCTVSPDLARYYATEIDGLLLTGAASDVDPIYYGEEPLPGFGYTNPSKVEFEIAVIEAAMERDLPIFGICGGMQVLNVACGGSLYQDIPSQVPNALKHSQESPAYAESHSVSVTPSTMLAKILGCERLRVNSTHHQSVKDVGEGLSVCATADDGVIEGIEHSDRPFVLAVQGHPENLYARHEPSQKIFAAFLAAASRFAEGK